MTADYGLILLGKSDNRAIGKSQTVKCGDESANLTLTILVRHLPAHLNDLRFQRTLPDKIAFPSRRIEIGEISSSLTQDSIDKTLKLVPDIARRIAFEDSHKPRITSIDLLLREHSALWRFGKTFQTFQ